MTSFAFVGSRWLTGLCVAVDHQHLIPCRDDRSDAAGAVVDIHELLFERADLAWLEDGVATKRNMAVSLLFTTASHGRSPGVPAAGGPG